MVEYIGTPTWATPLAAGVHDASTMSLVASAVSEHFTLDEAVLVATIIEREINERCM